MAPLGCCEESCIPSPALPGQHTPTTVYYIGSRNVFAWGFLCGGKNCKTVEKGGMSLLGMPLTVINLGGEMMYILEQRLIAQNIPQVYAVLVLCVFCLFAPCS